MAGVSRRIIFFTFSVLFLSVWSLDSVASPALKLRAGTLNLQALARNYQGPLLSSGPQNWVIQFRENTSSAHRQQILKNFQVLAYLPDHAYVILASSEHPVRSLKQSPEVFAVHLLKPHWKVSPELGSFSVFNAEEALDLLVQCYASLSCQRVAATLPAESVKVHQGNFLLLRVSRRSALSLAKMPEVEHLQPVPIYETFHFPLATEDLPLFEQNLAPLTGDESGTKAMDFSRAWEKGYRGEGQLVAYADTGLDVGDLADLHRDFQGAVLEGQAFGAGAEGWEDPQGHGTHVAGSLIGRGRASEGLLQGGAHGALLLAQGMWSFMKDGFTVPTQLENMFQRAYEKGARIHSNSWGSVKHPSVYDSAAVRVDAWTWAHPEMLVVFAAGNSGADLDRDGRVDPGSLATPATAKNALTVGASENVTSTGGLQVPIRHLAAAKELWSKDPIASSHVSDHLNGLAMFSSRGPTSDGRTKPDLVAPGSNILSVRSQMVSAMELWGAYNNDYVWSGGTSMAAPLVAAAATVSRQYLQRERGFSNPSAALLKALLLHSTIDMYPGQYGEQGAEKGQELLTRRPNSDQGHGRLSLASLVELGSRTQMVDHVGLQEKEEFVLEFDVSEGGSLLANLVWTDPPASANAAVALVNDLDLLLFKEGVALYESADHLNNTETLELSGLGSGRYRLVVRAQQVVELHGNRQPFALVLTSKAP